LPLILQKRYLKLKAKETKKRLLKVQHKSV
jgi:hypothetical protein